MAAAAIPFGLGIGVSLGMLGGGGSVLAVPVLVYILGQPVHQVSVRDRPHSGRTSQPPERIGDQEPKIECPHPIDLGRHRLYYVPMRPGARGLSSRSRGRRGPADRA